MKKVVYTEQQLSELLLGELLFIQQSHSDTENMETEIQDLYAKYDAFVKNEEYQLEEEVRFVVSIPKKYNAEDLKKI